MAISRLLRPAASADQAAILGLAVSSGLFQPQETGPLDGMLSDYFAGRLEDHYWIVLEDGDVIAAAYVAPEMMTDGAWNLYFIAVARDRQGRGDGTDLLTHVEAMLRDRGERLLLVETSGLNGFERTRAFYRKQGYDEEARIRDFYSAGDDKIVFRKAL